MKNPTNNVYLFQVQDGENKNLVSLAYSRSGIVRAFKGYGDEVLAKAGGYGYDKVGTALDDAVAKLTGKTCGVNGAAGVNSVIEAWKYEHCVRIINVLDVAITL